MAFNLSLPSLSFIIKVFIAFLIISFAMKMFPQLKQVTGSMMV